VRELKLLQRGAGDGGEGAAWPGEVEEEEEEVEEEEEDAAEGAEAVEEAEEEEEGEEAEAAEDAELERRFLAATMGGGGGKSAGLGDSWGSTEGGSEAGDPLAETLGNEGEGGGEEEDLSATLGEGRLSAAVGWRVMDQVLGMDETVYAHAHPHSQPTLASLQ